MYKPLGRFFLRITDFINNPQVCELIKLAIIKY